MNTNVFRSLCCVLSFSIFLYSCQSPSSKDETSKDSVATEAAFKPNPQEVPKQDVKTLEIGATAPDFSLPDVSGKFYSLKDFTGKVFVIFFTCNHCPTAQAYEDRMIQFTNDYKDKDVSVVAIMPNSTLGVLLEEGGWTDLNDSYEEMQIRYKDKGYNFPYLYDGDNQKVAIAYGPVTTPHVFVFDSERKLAYNGRLDAIEKPDKGANAEDLRAAVDAVLAGQKVENPVTKAFGCSVKWQWKSEYVKQVEKEWSEKPVTLEALNADGIKKLVSNPTKKLRLVNVWATWCAPCVAEYPEFIKIHRMYGQRNFEFVSLSADNPENKDKALEFLKKKQSPIQNYIYSESDKYKLIEALDPEWNGALPYTALIEPGGKIVYRVQGSIDPLELKRAIVEHPLMGRYY